MLEKFWRLHSSAAHQQIYIGDQKSIICMHAIQEALDDLFMIRIGVFLIIILLVGPAVAAKVNVTYCAQAHETASSRLKWALAHQHDNDAMQKDNISHANLTKFYKALLTPQTVPQSHNTTIHN